MAGPVRGGPLPLAISMLLLLMNSGDAQTTDCASTAAGCSGYSLIAAGSCAATAGCEAIATEADCRALHSLVDVDFAAGSGHFTVGNSQRDNVAAGCLLFTSANRHKFNANAQSTAPCTAAHSCFCTGDCAPLAAHAAPESVVDQMGTSGTGGSGGRGTGAPAPCPGGEGGGGGGGAGDTRCSAAGAALPALAALLWAVVIQWL